MEWMGTFVQIVYDKVHPYTLGSRVNRELIGIPLAPWKSNKRHWWVPLGLPSGLVEVPEWDVVVSGHLLDLGVHDMCLLGKWRQGFENGG